MHKVEQLEKFYAAWKALTAIPKRPGKQTPEWNAAKALLDICAGDVEAGGVGVVQVVIDPSVAEFRSLHQQILAVQPPSGPKPENTRIMDRTPNHG